MKNTILLSLVALSLESFAGGIDLLAQQINLARPYIENPIPPDPLSRPTTKSDAVLDQKIREIKARQLAQSLQPNLGGLKPGPLTNLPPFSAEIGPDTNRVQPTYYTKMSIPVGTNVILLNLRNGSVELPKDVPLDEVAVGFWQAVAHAFPYAFDWAAMCSERSLWTNQPVNAPVKQKVLD